MNIVVFMSITVNGLHIAYATENAYVTRDAVVYLLNGHQLHIKLVLN